MSKTDSAPARLYTIAPDVPFLDALARAILDGDLPVPGGASPGPLDLPRWTILLPTRRAARALGEAFLRAGGGAAMLLPCIRPLGDVDEDALALSAPPEPGGVADLALELLPAVGNMERRLALTQLVLKWSRTVAGTPDDEGFRMPATPAQASSLAAQLATLMDQLDTEQRSLDGLAELVPEQYAEHWQKTVEFLAIVTEHWPAHLEQNGVMPRYRRRDKLMEEEARRLRETPPAFPVIAAGSTATVPATADLLEAVARLDNGAVVLPGLDLELDEESWDAIAGDPPHPEHPQFGMQQFLVRMGVTRGDVSVLGGDAGAAGDGRARLISEIMRPAEKSEKWLELARAPDAGQFKQALKGITRIDAPGEQDEAEVISLLLRHAAEQPGKVAALVTPDRTLARRVSARLEKWDMRVDDSAGTPLAKTLPGSFMDALAEAAGSGFAAVPLLALLKHPMTRLGRSPFAMRRAARLLELAAFRQPALARGFVAHAEAVKRSRRRVEDRERVHPALRALSARDWDEIDKLLGGLETALKPLTGMFPQADREHSLAAMVTAHVTAGQALTRDESGDDKSLWRGEAGEALSGLVESLAAAGADFTATAADYPELYRSFVADVSVRPRTPAHPRIHIWGPLEARLQRPDMVVLGGLNESVWPASIDTGPWLNRPMCERLRLPAPERRIGLAAHDVAQMLGVAEVVLTRAQKAGGAPTVPSRWLLRLDAVLGALKLDGALEPEQDWLGWARARDKAREAAPVSAPAPCPPPDARPKRLSVTRVEDWIANPYAIFARDILRLQKLDDLAGEPDAALKGTLVHDALQRFAEAHPEKLPNDIAAELMRHARSLFGQFGDSARIETFWRGQFAVFAQWFAATEPARRAGVTRVHSEAAGEIEVPGANGFVLSARADRIDQREDGSLVIYDYKTGTPPNATQVADGRAPQLSLEAAIAQAGGFEGMDPAPVAQLVYISARGHGEGGAELDVSKKTAPPELADDALEALAELVRVYADETQGYAAMRRPKFGQSSSYRYDDYAHLARVLEWQAGDGGEAA